MIKTLFVFGTRPEAIKLCPVILHLNSQPEHFQVSVCVTAQHRSMLDQVLRVFGVKPDYDLDLMLPGQTLSQSTSRIISALEPVFAEARPDLAIVQGDTTTTFCGALAAFYQHVPVGHVEAGLRTHDLKQPFPEELNRVMTGRIADLHFAATKGAAANLAAEGVDSGRIFVTGNSGIDAVLRIRDRLERGELPAGDHAWRKPEKRLILVTAHRRESFGGGIESICRGLLRLAGRGDVQIVYPVHRNPNVTGPVHQLLGGYPDIFLIDPLDYVPFVALMREAYILITDSGGVQEEGPSLGKPILVTREKTERPEAVEAGTVLLVGPDEDRIFEAASRLLESEDSYRRLSAVHNPYGDGHASERIADAIRSFFRG
jgi:UDP-N-acetylglucosamine 2-epimerase (non-hydrolysing)